MLADELRVAFKRLDGKKAVRINFSAGISLEVTKALEDHAQAVVGREL